MLLKVGIIALIAPLAIAAKTCKVASKTNCPPYGCVDLQNNKYHCGTCDHDCTATVEDRYCLRGKCHDPSETCSTYSRSYYSEIRCGKSGGCVCVKGTAGQIKCLGEGECPFLRDGEKSGCYSDSDCNAHGDGLCALDIKCNNGKGGGGECFYPTTACPA